MNKNDRDQASDKNTQKKGEKNSPNPVEKSDVKNRQPSPKTGTKSTAPKIPGKGR
jgi:hypothetical protein